MDELNYDCRVDTLVIGSDEVFNCLQPYPVGYSKQLFGDGFEGNKLVSYHVVCDSPDWCCCCDSDFSTYQRE